MAMATHTRKMVHNTMATYLFPLAVVGSGPIKSIPIRSHVLVMGIGSLASEILG